MIHSHTPDVLFLHVCFFLNWTMSSLTWLWARGVPNASQGYGTSPPPPGARLQILMRMAQWGGKSPEVKIKWHHIILVSGQCNSACFPPETPTPSAPFLWQAFCKTALNFPNTTDTFHITNIIVMSYIVYIYLLNILKYLIRLRGQKHQGCCWHTTDEATSTSLG